MAEGSGLEESQILADDVQVDDRQDAQDGLPGSDREVDREDVPEPPRTGDDAVDEAVARLAQVATEPLETQVPVFDSVHRALQDRLADVEG